MQQPVWTALALTPALAVLAWLATARGWIGHDAGLMALVGCIAWLVTALQSLPACVDWRLHRRTSTSSATNRRESPDAPR